MNEAASIRLNVVFDPPIKFLIGRIYLLGEISTGRSFTTLFGNRRVRYFRSI